MGAYNTLHAGIACTRCGAISERAIRFKYADEGLYDYRVGETSRWGGNDEGVPGTVRVRVEGYAANAGPACGLDEEYSEILIERDVITGVRAVRYEELDIPPSQGFRVEDQ